MEINIEDYYVRYGPMVLRRCRQMLKNEENAMDAMHDVFTKLLLYRERLKGIYPSSLLFRISTNVCLNMIRDQRSHHSIHEENILTRIAFFDEREERFIINDLLGRIFKKKEKKSTRVIAAMHFVDGMTLKEVAAEVGLSLSGVRKRIKGLLECAKQIKEIENEG